MDPRRQSQPGLIIPGLKIYRGPVATTPPTNVEHIGPAFVPHGITASSRESASRGNRSPTSGIITPPRLPFSFQLSPPRVTNPPGNSLSTQSSNKSTDSNVGNTIVPGIKSAPVPILGIPAQPNWSLETNAVTAKLAQLSFSHNFGTIPNQLILNWNGEYAGKLEESDIVGTFESDGDKYVKLRGHGEQMFMFSHITKPDAILVDQLKEFFGLPKLGTCFVDYRGKYFVLVRPHMVSINKQGIDAKLSIIGKCDSARFERWIKLSWLFRGLMGFSLNNYDDIRVRLPCIQPGYSSDGLFRPYQPFEAPTDIPYPIVGINGNIVGNSSGLSQKIMDTWFPGSAYYHFTKELLGITEDTTFEDVELFLQEKISLIVSTVNANVKKYFNVDYSDFIFDLINNIRSIIFNPSNLEQEALSKELKNKKHKILLSRPARAPSQRVNKSPTIPVLSGPANLPIPDNLSVGLDFTDVPEDQFGEYPFSQSLSFIPPYVSTPDRFKNVSIPCVVNGRYTNRPAGIMTCRGPLRRHQPGTIKSNRD